MIPSSLFFLSYYKNTIVIEQITLAAGGSIGSSISEWLILNWGPYGSTVLSSIALTYSLILCFNLVFIFEKASQLIESSWFWFKRKLKEQWRLICTLGITQPSPPSNEKKSSTSKTRRIFRKLSPDSQQEIFRTNHSTYNQTGSEEREIAQLITKTLAEFGVEGKIIDYTRGPSLTIYNFQPAEGGKTSKGYESH